MFFLLLPSLTRWIFPPPPSFFPGGNSSIGCAGNQINNETATVAAAVWALSSPLAIRNSPIGVGMRIVESGVRSPESGELGPEFSVCWPLPASLSSTLFNMRKTSQNFCSYLSSTSFSSTQAPILPASQFSPVVVVIVYGNLLLLFVAARLYFYNCLFAFV